MPPGTTVLMDRIRNKPDTCGVALRMSDPGEFPIAAETTETGSRHAAIVVIVQASTPPFLERVGTALKRFRHAHAVVVTTPSGQEAGMVAVSTSLDLGARIVPVETGTSAAHCLLELLPGFLDCGHTYFCRLIEPAVSPTRDEQILCLLEGLVGSADLIDEIVASFVEHPALAILGNAMDRVSMRSETPSGLTKLALATPSLLHGRPTPWDWGYFASGCFWGRTSAFFKYLQMPQLALPADPTGHPPSVNTWGQVFERLFGLVAHLANGQLGLSDPILGSDATQPAIRILDREHAAGTRPLQVRLQASALHRHGLLERYLLLCDSGLLDPPWYYLQHLELTEEWEDCLLHHLRHPHTPLSQAHQRGETGYAIDADGLRILDRDDATTRWILPKHRFLSETLLADTSGAVPPSADGIKVSVICPTYNHERYLRECLDSLLMQEVDFDYEILVGDDASTDATPQILQEYARLHPQRIVAVLRPENIGPVANNADLLHRARGQYIAMCEGDDFWIGKDKLQSQADHFDRHPHCAAHFHPVKVLDEAIPGSIDVFPKALAGQAFGTDQIVRTNFIPTDAVMYRRSERLLELFEANISDTAMPLDWLCHIVASRLGELHMAPMLMGVYRKHPGGIWSQHTGPTFLDRWGKQYLEFHGQAMRVAGAAHHPLWCQRLLDLFGQLFHQYFLRSDATTLAGLVGKHRGIANLFFAKAGIAVEADDIVDEASMAKALRSALCVSTIVLTCDSAAYLQQCLDSVAGQRGLFTHEIVIADDASVDRTREISEAFVVQATVCARSLASAQRTGASGNFLRAIDACKGQYIAVCEGDDYWLAPDKIAKQLAYLLMHRSAPMCFNWLLVDHEGGARLPHPGQANLQRDQIGFEELLAEPLTANLSGCFYRQETLAGLPDSVRNAPLAGDWLLNLHAATLGPLGFIRDLLSAYRVHDGGQWSGLGNARKAELMRECYRSFLNIFPDRVKQIARFLPLPAAGAAMPTELAMRNSPGLRFHLDRLDCNPAFLSIAGWLTQAEIGSHEDEEKYLFIISESGQVVHFQRMDNVRRPDVHRYYRDKLGIGNLDFTWAGCRALVVPTLEDGGYRLAAALRRGNGMEHALLKPVLRVHDGIFDV
jgi:glycosyltransferase involved in cell wall biosynthesis